MKQALLPFVLAVAGCAGASAGLPARSLVSKVRLIPANAPGCELSNADIDALYDLPSSDKRMTETRFATVLSFEFTTTRGTEYRRVHEDGSLRGDKGSVVILDGLDDFTQNVSKRCNQ